MHHLEPRQGSIAWFSVVIDGVDCFFGGPVTIVETACELTLTIQWEGARAWPAPTYWTFRLASFNGQTQVELFHYGFKKVGDAAADTLAGYEAGWDTKHLAALRALITV